MVAPNPNRREPVNRTQPTPQTRPSSVQGTSRPTVNPRYTQRMIDNPPPRNVPPGTRWEGTHNREYWENPQTVVRYHRLAQTSPPGWKPPEWLDMQKVETAYRYMQHRNNYRDPSTWLWLPQDDPGRELTLGMQLPPQESMTWWEQQRYYPPVRQSLPSVEQLTEPPARPFGDWDDLKNWQKVLLGAFSPNTPGLQDRPEWTRAPGTLFQAGLAGLGTAAGGAAIGSVLPGVGTALGGAVGFGVGFLGTAYSTWTGQEIPVLSDVMRVFNIPAEWLEQTIGLGVQGSKSGFDDVIQNLPAAWEAGRATYETMGPGATNTLAPLAGAFGTLLGMEYDWDPNEKADKGQVWQFEKGIVDPVTLNTADAAGLTTIRSRVERLLDTGMSSEEAWGQIYAEVVDTYGFDGTFNDFVLQSVLDPLNLVPFAEGKIGKVVAEKMGNPRLAAAFEASTGNPLVDALPFGVQGVVAWITKQKTSDGAMAAWDLYRNWVREGTFPREMMRLPADIDEQYSKVIAQGVDPKAITFEGKEMRWLDADGNQQVFVGQQDVPSLPAAADLSDFEKWAAGLDKEGRIVELLPDDPKGNYAKTLSTMTPMAKATVMLHTMHDQINLLLSRAGGDPAAMVKMLKQLAGVEAYKAGDMGELMFKSPIAATIQAALRNALKDGKLDTILSEWGFAAQKRTLLQKVAEAVGMRPAEFLEALADRPEQITARVNEVAPALGKPEFLQDTLAVFIGEDALPWNENQFQARVALAVFDTMDDWLKDSYGLKPESGVFRLGKVLKGMQSLLLLGLNPAYFINNSVNNVVTRAAVGVFGFMTPKQIDDFMNRFGITPSRMGEGIGPTGDAIEGSLAGLQKAVTADDGLAKVQKVVSSWNKKLGIFSRFSGKFEALESKQAYAIGIQRWMGANWKRDKGFNRMPAYLEKALNDTAPGMAEMIYRTVEAGMNQQEIEQALFGSFLRPTIEGIADDVARQVMPGNPELLKDIINRQGIANALKERLDRANTEDEIDFAFDSVESDVLDAIRSKMLEDLIVRAEDVRNQVGQEQIAGVLQLYGDMEIDQANRWIAGRREWEDLYARRENMTEEQWTREVRALFAKQDEDWTRWRSHELQTIKGILQALQIEGPDATAFVDKMMAIHLTWREFHTEARKLRDVYFDQAKRKPGEKWEAYSNRRNMLWTTLQDSLDDLYVKHYDVEKAAQMAMDGLFAKMYQDMTGWDPQAAGSWRASLRDKRYEMFHAQREMRARTRNMTPIERDAAYAEFNPVYNRMIADMKKLEHDGAYALARRAAPPADVQVPPARPDNMPEPPPPADADAGATTPGAQQIMRLARSTGVFSDSGVQITNPVSSHVLNIINKSMTEKGHATYASLNDVPEDMAREALAEHHNRHIVDRATAVARVKGLAQQIMSEADADRRAAIAQKNGMLVRKTFRQQLEKAFAATQQELDAVMVLTDMVADTWARRSNRTPDQASRDAWYAGHVSKIVDSYTRGPHLDVQQRLQQYGHLSPEEGTRKRFFDVRKKFADRFGIDEHDNAALEAKAVQVLNLQRTAMNGVPTDLWNEAYEFRQAFLENRWLQKYGQAFDFADYGELTRTLNDSKVDYISSPYEDANGWHVRYQVQGFSRPVVRDFETRAEARDWADAYREGTYLYQAAYEDAQRGLFQRMSRYDEDLVALHNLKEEAFNFAHEFGGLAAPSIAVIKPEIGFDSYGEITLVGKPDLVDPSQPRVFSYNSDAYTPRMPEPVYGKVRQADFIPFRQKFEDFFWQAKETSQWWRFEAVLDKADFNQAYIDMTNSPAMILAYLKDRGKPELPLIYAPATASWNSPPLRYEFMGSAKVLEHFKKLPADIQAEINRFSPSYLPDGWASELRDLIVDYYTTIYPEAGMTLGDKAIETLFDEEGNLWSTMFGDVWYDYGMLTRSGGAQVDRGKTLVAWKQSIDENDFRSWARKELSSLFGAPKLRLKGKLVDYTMANAVKAMSVGEVVGGELQGAQPSTMGSARGLMVERVSDFDELHQWADSLITKNKLNEWVEETGAPAMKEAQKAYTALFGDTGDDPKTFALNIAVRAWRNADGDGMVSSRAVYDAAVEYNATYGSGPYLLPYELVVPSQRRALETLADFTTMLGNAPVNYFETKVMRPVSFNEFTHALVPDTALPATIERLKGYGMEVITYAKGERNQAIKDLPPSVLFQDASTPSAARASVDFLKDGRAIIHAMQQPNVSSIVHEIAHIFRRDLPESDLDAMAKLGGLTGADELRVLEQKFWTQSGTPMDYQRYRDAEETFARGWERYLAEGDAPTPALRSLFKTFSNWMLTIYRRLFRSSGKTVGFREQAAFLVAGSTVNINASVGGISLKDIFDRMLVEEVDRPRTLQEKVSAASDPSAVIADILSPYQDAEDAMRAAVADPYDPANGEILQALDYAKQNGMDPFVGRTDPDVLRRSQQEAAQYGRMIALDDIRDASTLNHGATLPDVAAALLRRALSIFADESPNARRFVGDYVSHRLSGTTDALKLEGYGLTEHVIRSLMVRVDDAMGVSLRGAAELLNKPVRISPAEVPSKGLYAGRIYSIMHGDQRIVSAVYNDGKMVALVPDTLRNFDVRDGVRTLGIDPDNPARWVMQNADGKIYSFDPNAPGLSQAPDYGLMAGRKQVTIPEPGQLLREHDYRAANRTIDEIVLYQNDDGTIVDELKWREPNQRSDIYSSVNNRIFRELESVELLMGIKVEGTFPGPGAEKKITRTIRPRDMFLAIAKFVDEGGLARLVDPNVPIEQIVRERNIDTSTALGKLRVKNLKETLGLLRRDYAAMMDPNSPALKEAFTTDNGKAGLSVDFLLATCQPTTPCRECYAAGILRQTVIAKSTRNVFLMLANPEGFGRQVAKEVAKYSKIDLPFLRLLGSGDLTSPAQVTAFNAIAANLDRPIHIFSRHHENLAQLHGTQKAPFVKMGSIDADLYNYYGPDKLARNFEEGQINNGFLYTDPSELPMIMDLYNRGALGLVLSAAHELHDTLPPEIRKISCPCDAGERTFEDSCRQCALSMSGCFMVYAENGVDANGNVVKIKDAEGDVKPMLSFLLGDKIVSKQQAAQLAAAEGAAGSRAGRVAYAYAKALESIVARDMMNLFNVYGRELEKSYESFTGKFVDKGKKTKKGTPTNKIDRTSVTLKDKRFGDQQVELVASELYLAKMNAEIDKWNAKNALAKKPKPSKPHLTMDDLVSTPERRYMSYEDVRANMLQFRERQERVVQTALNDGSFYLPGGEIQLPVIYEGWKKMDVEKEASRLPEEIEKRRPILMQDVESSEFTDWFSGSKIVDEDGGPLRVFHGSTHIFDTFDQNKVSPEGYYGAGFYFTSGAEDASRNYAGIGPDLEAKIAQRAEEIMQNWQDEGEGWNWGSQKYSRMLKKAERQAEAELVGQARGGVILPVYLSMKNPMDLSNTRLEVLEEIDPDTGEVIGEPSGSGWDLLNAVEEVLADNGFDNVAAEHREYISERTLDYMLDGSLSGEQFDKVMRESFQNGELYDQYTGNYITGELMRQVYERAGYDGIIMDAGRAFRNMLFVRGEKHYIAFEPTQIKSTFNAGTWSKTDPNILHQVANQQLVDDTISALGVTDDLKKATFVMPDGTMIDGSEGGRYRTVEHLDQVEAMLNLEDDMDFQDADYEERLPWLRDYLKQTSAVRVAWFDVPSGGLSIESATPISRAQAEALEAQLIKRRIKEVELSYENVQNWMQTVPIKDFVRTVMELSRQAPVLEQRSMIDDLSWAKEVSFRTAPQSEAFERFFEGSKVVDENGQPLRVFHGTAAPEEFDAFRTSTRDIGIHFGSAGQANDRLAYTSMTSKKPGSQRVIAGYLNIKNPLRLVDLGAWDIDNLAYGVRTTLGEDAFRKVSRMKTIAQVRKYLQKLGYDGIVYKNTGEVEGGAEFATRERDAFDRYHDRAVSLSKEGKKEKDDPEIESLLEAARRTNKEYAQFREENGTDSFIAFDPRQFKAENNQGEWNPRNKRMLLQEEPQAMGQAPLNGTPVTQPEGRATEEMYLEQVRPALAKMRQAYKDGMVAGSRNGPIDSNTQRALRGWIGGVKQSLSDTKHQAMIYGQQMRDSSLLNYNRRYGADNLAELVVPYQFWYTRSMLAWAKRMVDRPAWFAMYARLAEAQKRMERKGMPSRLNGKSRIPMPWMPDWMGGGLWQDPWSKLLPFATFGQPLEQFAMDKQQIARRTEQILQDQVESGEITEKQRVEAMTMHDGAAWKDAYAQAQVELDKSANPTSLVSMMFQPALWWTIPTNLANGTPEKINPTPMTRFGQGIRAVGRGTVAEPLTNLAGAVLAGPEEAIRRQVKLSEFGEWGDYYIDKHLAAMAAEGSADPDQVVIAMIERQGPLYEEAKRRVSDEIALRQPGFAGLMAAREGGNAAQILSATLTMIFGGGGLFPEGELKFRNLKADYDQAWRDLNAGDEEAIDRFFEENPEYAGRLALYKEPEERLRSFLVNAIWDGYFALDKPNRKQAVKALGPEFEASFLNSETRSIEGLDARTLAAWAQALGKQVPETEETAWRADIQPSYWDQGMVSDIENYQTEKDQRFPNISTIQSIYFDTPAGVGRKQLLAQFPELKAYWDWKDQYATDHPEIVPYFEELKQDSQSSTLSAELTSPLARQLMGMAYGQKLSTGAVSELRRLWEQYGQDMDYEDFQAMMVVLAMSMR